MFKRISNTVFILMFMLVLILPLIFTNLQEGKVSEAEKRVLLSPAKLYKEDGSKNTDFYKDFENWFNDNIGFRSWFVLTNARMQYYLFDQLSNNSDMILGEDKVVNYASDEIISDYQRFNLKTDDELKEIAESYQFVNEYLAKQGIQYYYMQCWDKHSIYPEHFPTTIYQYGDLSKTDQIVNVLNENTDVAVINFKPELIDGKEKYETYSKYGDPTHWSERGSYIGYCSTMNEINRRNDNRYKVLGEEEYDLSFVDKGITLFGGIHREQLVENFAIKEPHSVMAKEKLTLYSEDVRHKYRINNYVDNDTRLLILGDSYLDSYLEDDFAESFHETILIWGDYTSDLYNIVNEYKPDIILNENAERCDRTYNMIKAAENIRMHGYMPGSDIIFTSAGRNCDNYVVRGISEGESDYSWTNGKEMDISLLFEDDLHDELTADVYIDGVYHGEQRVIVSVNDLIVFDSIVKDEDRLISFSFDNTGSDVVNLHFDFPDAGSPYRNSESDADNRELAVKIKSMNIHE